MAVLVFLLLFVILSVYECDSCSFSIEGITQTPFLNVTRDGLRSPDCDDTAIIINELNMSDSLIVGTLKEGGLEVYNLNGNLLQHIEAPNPPYNNITNKPGRFNNVAVIKSLKDSSKTIVIVSDRGLDQLRFYTLNSNGMLYDITNTTIPWIFSTSQEIVNKQQTAYGLTATNYNNKMTAFVSKRHQNIIAKVNIIEIGDLISYEVVDILTLPIQFDNGWKACTHNDDENTQIEGMVVDPKDGTLLIAVEIVGLFKTSIVNESNYKFELIDTVTTFGVEYWRVSDVEEEDDYKCIYNGTDHGLGGNIVADAEGISLYVDNDDTINGGFYVLSCQGSNSFNIYSRKSFVFIGNFTIFLGDDKVEHTDGVEIMNGDFGDDYSEGIIIVQDEGNNGQTNFKFASFEHILDGIYECDENMNTTIYYSSMIPQTTISRDYDETDESAKKIAILVLSSVFVVLLLVGIGIFIYFKCLENCKNPQKEPNNYVELQNK